MCTCRPLRFSPSPLPILFCARTCRCPSPLLSHSLPRDARARFILSASSGASSSATSFFLFIRICNLLQLLFFRTHSNHHLTLHTAHIQHMATACRTGAPYGAAQCHTATEYIERTNGRKQTFTTGTGSVKHTLQTQRHTHSSRYTGPTHSSFASVCVFVSQCESSFSLACEVQLSFLAPR